MKKQMIKKITSLASAGIILGNTNITAYAKTTVDGLINIPTDIQKTENTLLPITEELLTTTARVEVMLQEAKQKKEEDERIKRELEVEKMRLIEEEERRIRAEQEAIRKANIGCDLDNVLKSSNLTASELRAVFNHNNYSKEMGKLADIIIEAEEIYGINAFILSAIASWESDYCRSSRAKNDYNVLGWGVHSASSTGYNSSSYYECIMKAAKFLREEYLTPDGLYYKNLSTWSIAQSYCPDDKATSANEADKWRIGVNSIAKNYEFIAKNYIVK